MPALDEERRELNAEFNWIVGINVSTFRLRRGMMQTELARQADMHKSVLNRVEVGQRSLKFREAVCIAKALGLKVETLTKQYEDIDYKWA